MSGTLLVTVDPAWPPVSGADHRNWQIARAAAARGPVRLLSVLGPVGQSIMPEPGVTGAALSRASAASVYCRPPKSSTIDLTLPPDTGSALAGEIARMTPDHVIFEHLALHPLLDDLARRSARLILDMHNIESELAFQQTSGWERILGVGQRRVAEIRAIEQRACARVDSVWACSTDDALRVAALCPSGPRPQVVPNGIPCAELAPQQLARHRVSRDGPSLLFLGHLGYPPNIAAAELLANRILPSVRVRAPAARLILAGRSPDARVMRLRSDAVKVLPDPRDVTNLLQAADIAAVPLTMGSGTRLKIIEAMAWGVPVVATARAVEGLDLIDGTHIRLAETPRQFAKAIVALHADPAAYAAQREAAHADALARFGPAAIAAAVAEGLRAAGTPG